MASASPRDTRILFVEDEALLRIAVVEELQDLGFAIDEAGTAGDAMRLAREHPAAIAAAVIDFNLPDRKGDSLATDLRELIPGLPIIIVSAYRISTLRGLFAAHGTVQFLEKPYQVDALVPLLAAAGVESGQQA